MPYKYLEDIATADVAFEATGETVEEMFTAAAEATMGVMVSDLSAIQPQEEIHLSVEHEEIDMLLFNFLQELIFYKDSRLLLLRASHTAITRTPSGYLLTAHLQGEQIDSSRHPMNVDVKAVTLHRFAVEQTASGWKATVVLDI